MTNHAAGRTLDFEYSCVVEAYERVTVRAGSFDAFKVVCENQYTRDVSWSSPANGLNVKTDNQRKPGNPSGEGTQRGELTAIRIAK
jgi:hypothetical protein